MAEIYKSNLSKSINEGTKPSQTEYDELLNRYRQLQTETEIQKKILGVSNKILKTGGTFSTLEDTFAAVVDICQTALEADASVIEICDAGVYGY